MTESWVRKYDTVDVESDSLAMESESNNVPYASQIGSGRIVVAHQFDMEMYFEGGAEEDLLCLVCFMQGRDEQKSHLRLTEKGIRKGFFQHVNEEHHSEEEIWRVWVTLELTEKIRDQNPSLIIENGTLDIDSYDGDILASSSNMNVAVEVQSNYALKRDIRKRNGIHKKRQTLDQWIYPPHIQPEVFMKDARNLMAGTGEKSVLGYYVMALKVTSKISKESKTFNLSVNDEALVRKLSSAQPFDFERVKVFAVMTDLEEWSFGQEGFNPSWGTSAFDIKQHFADEVDALNDFIAQKHQAPAMPLPPAQKVLREAAKQGKLEAVELPVKPATFESEAESSFDESAQEVARGRLLWFVETYFHYASSQHRNTSLELARKINMETFQGVIQLDGEWIARVQEFDEHGFFWRVEKIEGNILHYSVSGKWKQIINSMSDIHQVSANGKTLKIPKTSIYEGAKNVEAVLSLVGEFKAALN